jgi:hypothetical protein
MARSRNIKPGFAKNEFLADRSHAARLLFALLPTIADREGRLEDRPMRIKGELFPYEQIDVDALLCELAQVKPGQDHPFVIRYEVAGLKYIQVVKFSENQNPHKDEKPSEIPAPKPSGTSAKAPCKYDAEHDTHTVSALDMELKESEKRESGTGNPESEQPSIPEAPFERFWGAVHNKKDKRNAEKAYNQAVKRLIFENRGIDPHEFLLERMTAFAATPDANPSDRTPILPTTWLNGGRYDDDPATWQRGSPAKNNSDPRGNLALRDRLKARLGNE